MELEISKPEDCPFVHGDYCLFPTKYYAIYNARPTCLFDEVLNRDMPHDDEDDCCALLAGKIIVSYVPIKKT